LKVTLDTEAGSIGCTAKYVMPLIVQPLPGLMISKVGGPGGQEVYAMCAVDALAISLMFGVETCIDSKCHATGEPIYICQKGKAIVATRPTADIRVGIRWQQFSTCAAHTLCTEMVFLKDASTAAHWKNKDPEAVELFTLPEAVEYAGAFFLPLLEE